MRTWQFVQMAVVSLTLANSTLALAEPGRSAEFADSYWERSQARRESSNEAETETKAKQAKRQVSKQEKTGTQEEARMHAELQRRLQRYEASSRH
ncbi:MAG: hypothetical protein IT285_13675 [Bdellovibrionales bacterium]|nr:hypothetical protein [Bdellovibrionales bacterium]